MDPFQQKGGYVLRSPNIMMAYKPYNPVGHRIQHIEIKGKPLQKNKKYSIVGGGEQILKAHQTGRRWLGVKAHEALKHYFDETTDVTIDNEPRIICV